MAKIGRSFDRGSCLRRNSKKKGKLPTSHRYDRLPLLRSRPGGFNRSWLCRTCRLQRYNPFKTFTMIFQTDFK